MGIHSVLTVSIAFTKVSHIDCVQFKCQFGSFSYGFKSLLALNINYIAIYTYVYYLFIYV